MEIENIIRLVDILLYAIVLVTVIYITVYTVASMLHRNHPKVTAKRQNRFVVIIPAYKADATILGTVRSVLGQTYPQRLFDVTVVSDQMKELTNFKLAQFPITLLTPNFTRSTKARSLQYAINNLPQFKIYDAVILLDSDNIVLPEFIEEVNDAYELAGTKAIQFHRVSRNRDTSTAILDSIFEEINNSIFRRGHVAVGMSSALSGSGMVFDLEWFKRNIREIHTAWEDKELEARLMRQHIYVDYFDSILVFDGKQRDTDSFNRQRSRWVSTQMRILLSNIRYLPSAIFHREYDFIDKLLQWMIMPRTMLMGIIVLMCVLLPWFSVSISIKWWLLFAFVLFVFAMAVPNYLVDKNFDRAFLEAPKIMFSQLFNIVKMVRFRSFININRRR